MKGNGLKLLLTGLFVALSFLCTSCTFEQAEIGSVKNPIKIFFVPSVEAQMLEDQSSTIAKLLKKYTGYEFEIRIPTGYIAVVEAFGSKRADIGALNTFGYILAHDKYGAEAHLRAIRNGHSTYRAQILARADDTSIQSLADLAGKRVAFVDPASTSGYLLPMKTIKESQVKTGETVFAMKHDNVVSMIYQKQVDAGATFYSPPANGEIQDARRLVMAQYPDVEKKIKIVKLTEEIPNEPVVFRKDLPEEVKQKLKEGFLKLVKDPEGKEALMMVATISDLKETSDADYKPVRTMLKELGESVEKLARQ